LNDDVWETPGKLAKISTARFQPSIVFLTARRSGLIGPAKKSSSGATLAPSFDHGTGCGV